jgi:large subunit ribosomal protein L25
MKKTKEDKEVFLAAEKRTLFGKKLKKPRLEGKTPANIFGQNFTSMAISVDAKEFKKVYQNVKKTGILRLKLEKEEIPVLIFQIQLHPVNQQILHVDFRKVDLKQKLITEVPVKIVGQSPAVEQKGGYLLISKDRLQIEALPEDIPTEITIDIGSLAEINQEIKVEQIKIEGKYQIKEEPQTTVVSVIAHKEERIEPEAAPATEVPTAKAGEKTGETSETAPTAAKDNQPKEQKN